MSAAVEDRKDEEPAGTPEPQPSPPPAPEAPAAAPEAPAAAPAEPAAAAPAEPTADAPAEPAADAPAEPSAAAAASQASQAQAEAAAEIEQLLQKARSAQRQLRWLEAAETYRKVLDRNPGRAPIWVQYGHMLKEGGKPDEAAAAYQSALDLEPTNADTHLQFGHLYKITNKKQRAIQMYSRALELDPQLKDAVVELERLGAKSRADFIARRARRPHAGRFVLFFEITDLMIFFNGHRTPTGIQRISLAIIEAALASEHAKHIELCMLEVATGAWKPISSDDFMLLVMLSREGAKTTDPAWRSALESVLKSVASSAPIVFPEQSVIVNLGSPWGIPNYFMAIREAKRQSDVLYVAFVHDTIPLLLPELCDGPTSSTYTRWIAGLGLHADLILANAENTRRDLLRAIKPYTAQPPACKVIQPNGDFSLFFNDMRPVSDEVRALIGSKFALFVGTIEPRKNHQFVLAAWRKLIAELGPHQVPTLVLAGKLGWHCEAVVEFLRRTDGLDGKIRVFHEASDVDLQSLYKNALFTIYNSHYEGWGLPVTESLSFQKVPVVAKNSALIESGGQHAIFFESNSEPSFLATIRAIIANPQSLLDREEAIRDTPAVRPWEEIFLQVHDAVAKLTVARAASLDSSRVIEPGKIYAFGLETALRNPGDFAIAEATRVGTGWHGLEDWGTWTAKPIFELSMNVASASGRQTKEHDEGWMLLYLHMKTQIGTRLRVELNGTAPQTFVIPGNREVVLKAKVHGDRLHSEPLRILATQNGMVNLGSTSSGKDARTVGVGLKSFMICDENDTAAKVRLIEDISMGYISPIADVLRADGAENEEAPSTISVDRSAAA